MVNQRLTVVVCVQSLAENDLNTFEFKSLSDAVDEIKKTIDPSNIRWVADLMKLPCGTKVLRVLIFAIFQRSAKISPRK